jgi:hypothetical protein
MEIKSGDIAGGEADLFAAREAVNADATNFK